MIKSKQILLIAFVCISILCQGQLVYNNCNQVWLNNSANIVINGDIINAYGDITLTNSESTSSELIINGNAINNADITANGIISLSGNWYNNSNFTSDSGEMRLTGSSQLLSGTETTEFYSLIATASGIKTLTIDQEVYGILDIADAEFSTDEFKLVVLNTSINAIEYNEGFVSSDEGCSLVRLTSTEGKYVFPVGSHICDDRVRPVFISQYEDENAEYQVRFINNSATLNDMQVTSLDTLSEYINELFYHEVVRPIGNETVLLEIEFESEDGSFDGIVFWSALLSEAWTTIENSDFDETDILCFADSVVLEEKVFFALSHKYIPEEPPPPPPEDPDFMIYNSFSPNGDDYNDTWIIDAINTYPDCKISIYNRNGNLVYYSEGYETPWNGEFKGENVPDATYYYIVDLYGDGSDLRKGNVTIIR
ncbi:MAG: hypothetical protein C0596_14880 [Marinilabiliales bacterium]|nr:MAG: hypothetical protein C0596_14880 [Marinilabiliales bacterium]